MAGRKRKRLRLVSVFGERKGGGGGGESGEERGDHVIVT